MFYGCKDDEAKNMNTYHVDFCQSTGQLVEH